MTNASLRDRFGIESKNSSMISRLIKESIEVGMIKDADPGSDSRKHARYLPYWV